MNQPAGAPAFIDFTDVWLAYNDSLQAAGQYAVEAIDLKVGQVLNINTGDLDVDSYSGEVENPEIAEFIAGHDDGSAQFNPGVAGRSPGTTTVVLSNKDGGIEDITFTVVVSP